MQDSQDKYADDAPDIELRVKRLQHLLCLLVSFDGGCVMKVGG